MKRKKINFSSVFAGRVVGIKEVGEVGEKSWSDPFMDYDLGCFDEAGLRFEPVENPFGARVLPMCPA